VQNVATSPQDCGKHNPNADTSDIAHWERRPPRYAITLADVRSPTIEIACEPYGRRGRYNVERLIAKHGSDVKVPDLKMILANCEKARSV
jgi:hypothetical protein